MTMNKNNFMDIDFKRKIEERMQEIPAPLARAIQESGWENIVFDIGRKYNLHVDDIGEMQNELILVLVGITHPEEFRSILLNEIRIPSDKIDLIINDLNVQINEKIKNSLKKHLDIEESEVEEVKEESLKSQTADDHEKKVLKKAGVSFGDEPEEGDDKQVASRESQVATNNEEKFIVLDPVAAEGKETPVVKKPTPEPAPAIPDISVKLQNGAVFKGKSTEYLDPYREPVE